MSRPVNAEGARAGEGEGPLTGSCPATACVDRAGAVRLWSAEAEALLGYSAKDVCGMRAVELLISRGDREAALAGRDRSEVGRDSDGGVLADADRGVDGVPVGRSWDGVLGLRHRDGHEVKVALRVRPLTDRDGPAGWVVSAGDARRSEREDVGRAMTRALFEQYPAPIALVDDALRYRVLNKAAERALTRPGDQLNGRHVGADTSLGDSGTVDQVLRQVRETGEPVLGLPVRGSPSPDPDGDRMWSLSTFRLTDPADRPLGMCQTYLDITDGYRAERRLALLTRAGAGIGATLDVARTAQELADVLVPDLGDVAWVALSEAVLEGDEPPKMLGPGEWNLRRTGAAPPGDDWPTGLPATGAVPPTLPDHPLLRRIGQGETVLLPDRDSLTAAAEGHLELAHLFVPEHGHSVIAAPLFARGLVLGTVVVWRTRRPGPFRQEDADLLTEIASRAALGVDNARRYTREHRAAVALQQRLLPAATTDTPAAETVGFYVPAGGGAEIGGDWYDVIALPSFRVALVAGDVTGHGLPATATMGRLRTAVDTLADLELEPDELLTHLDGLVHQLQAEAPHQGDTVGAGCLYAVYDPVTCQCTLASAGHPPPVVIRPDGTVESVEVSPGPLLGVGGMPFEATTFDLEPGSIVAVYTKGLVYRDDHDADAGLRRLTDGLARFAGPGRDLDGMGHELLRSLGDAPARDDMALLLARTRAIAPENTATWEFPADESVVAAARKAAAGQLTAWGLDAVSFTTELVVSELVTNAVRYAGGPIGLRLIRENTLVCEVNDPSNTQPRLRRARWSDEGGRGLFLIAQLTTRWGSRYTRSGKTIWTEQSLTAEPGMFDLPPP
ncbi:SpoIIE family protein phosphatase [Streptomyces sp. NPDC127584]|uniref:SpoIIE family protein phosphatase n=1 Tax=Streptomyces sp. NPDC127584 TaxID=3345403 RepID=UPI003633B565